MEIFVDATNPVNRERLEEELEILGYGPMFVGEPGEYPGRISIQPQQDLDQDQIDKVVAAANNHDPTLLTDRQYQEETLDDELAELADIEESWDTMNAGQQQAAMRKAIRIIVHKFGKI